MSRQTTRLRAWTLGLASLLALAAGSAAMASTPRACFASNEVRDWRPADARTLYLRVRTTDYYRVDLTAPIKLLRSPTASLMVGSRTLQVCDAADLDLDLTLSSTQRLPLGASGLSRLSAEEIAAIGQENLPGRLQRGPR